MKNKKQRVERLLLQPLDQQSSIAFICSFCLGDSLMSLVTVSNLIKNGFKVDVYGEYAYALREWFPNFRLFPLLSINEQHKLAEYDVVLHMYRSELSKQVATWHPASITMSDSMCYIADMTMTDIQVTLCQKEFGLTQVERINNIQPLPGLVFRKCPNRIIFHPTSSLLRKNWPSKKFLKLAKQLQSECFENHFIVSPQERPSWLWVEQEGIHLPNFASLGQVASFIYESGYFIGNDSGIGHLASNLGIPTVSIILRKGVAKQWRPSWAPGRVVLSPNWLNPRPIKEKLWKFFTRVTTVKSAFDDLRNDFEKIAK